jgi:glucosyl-dolichyl phosphate glucuronosyltransferase
LTKGNEPGGGSNDAPLIDVAICTHNRPELCERAVASALAQSGEGARATIFVVDNGGEIAARDRLEKSVGSLPRVTYLADAHAGLSRARNTAMDRSSARYLAFMDDDAVATPDWLQALLTAFRSFENAGVVGGPVEPEFEIPPPPWFSDRLRSYISAVDWGGSLRVASAREWFAGTNFAIDLSAVRRTGGFREDLGRVGSGEILLSGEETELCTRLIEAGYLAIWQPHATVRHRTSADRLTQSWLRRRASWQAVSDSLHRPDPVSKTASRWQAALDGPFGGRRRHRRGLNALFKTTETADEFAAQISAIYGLTALLLSGQDLEIRDGAAAARSPGLARLMGKLYPASRP